MKDHTAKRLSALHTLLYRITAGRIGRRLVANDMLLLSTVGRVTGETHTVPLLYLRDGTDFVVIASWGGRDRNPEWYLNLLQEPSVRIQVEEQRLEVIARIASSGERSRIWPQVLEAFDGYREYQSRTDREIPVVLLSPRD